MARVVTFIGVVVGLLIMMNLAGIPTASHQILDNLGYFLNNILSSQLATSIAAIFILVGSAGIIAGLFTKSIPESYFIAPLAGFLLAWGLVDLSSLIGYVNSVCPAASDCAWIAPPVSFILWITIAAYCISIVQWWRGGGDV